MGAITIDESHSVLNDNKTLLSVDAPPCINEQEKYARFLPQILVNQVPTPY